MKNIIGTAVDAGKFTTLLGALQAAALTDELRATGPFTLLAPTDDAFKRLPAGTIDALIADIPRLKAILTLHVLPQALQHRDIQPGSVTTLDGRALEVSMQNGMTLVGGAKIIHPDIAASNGVIHAINLVLMPGKSALAAVA